MPKVEANCSQNPGLLMRNSLLSTAPHESLQLESAIISLGIPRAANSFPVPLNIDGCSVVGIFEVSIEEHSRRLVSGASAITSTSALHALWELPFEVPIPLGNLTPLVQVGLKKMVGTAVESSGDQVIRTYQPPGRLLAVVAVKGNVRAGLSDLSMFPPIFYRGLLTENSQPPSEQLALALTRGVGVVGPVSPEMRCLLSCRDPERGSPSVYRWWVAELAYRQYLRIGSPLN
jgi:hypothetical protein